MGFVIFSLLPGASFAQGDEQQNQPNRKMVSIVALHVLHNLFGFVIITTVYQLSQYEPSATFTLEHNGMRVSTCCAGIDPNLVAIKFEDS